jgi:hypothetical protein
MNSSSGAGQPFFALNTNEVNWSDLIVADAPTQEMLAERSDADDPYRFMGKLVGADPFFLNNQVMAFLSVGSFQKFSLVPSKLFGTNSVSDTDKAGAYYASLPPCQDSNQFDCISEFSAIADSGKSITFVPFAKLPSVDVFGDIFKAYTMSSDTYSYGSFKGNPSRNLPSGGDLWLWKVEGDDRQKPTLYSASVVLSAAMSRNQNSFQNPDTRIQITPVVIDKPIANCSSGGGCAWTDINKGQDGAIFDSKTISVKRTVFSVKGRFTLKFRTTVPWTSWLMSTISDVDLSGTKIQGGFSYQVSGLVSRIPSIRKSIPVTPENKDLLVSMVQGDPCSYQPTHCAPMIRIGGSYVDERAFKVMVDAEKVTDSVATYSTDSWALMTADFASPNNRARTTSLFLSCIDSDNGFLPSGITGSNATIFQHEPPTWNTSEGSFAFKVASFSKNPEGKTYYGDYSLMINSKVAKCLWGDGVSSASAKVEVLNQDGTNQVATSEIGSNSDWLRFRSSGFHFSSPTIKLTIPKASTTAQPTPMPTASPTIKVTTISCIKGKQIKKVSGQKASCPKGFKLKP